MLAQCKAFAKRSGWLVRAVRATYPALNWIRNRPAFYLRVAPYLARMEFDEVLLSGRGNEPEAHLRRTKRLHPVRDADVLVLGVGHADELGLWLRERPRSLTAVDFFARARWREYPGVAFARMDVRRLGFADASFDIVASTALLEHVDGVELAVREMARVVRPTGLVFANFGPLYYTHGGAHYLGAFEHLLMPEDEFVRYLERRGIPYEREEALFYLRHGMFSRWTYRQYLEAFRRHFEMDHVTLHVSPQALAFRRRHPDVWRALTARYDEEDLLTFAATVWMRPKASGEEAANVAGRPLVEAR